MKRRKFLSLILASLLSVSMVVPTFAEPAGIAQDIVVENELNDVEDEVSYESAESETVAEDEAVEFEDVAEEGFVSENEIIAEEDEEIVDEDAAIEESSEITEEISDDMAEEAAGSEEDTFDYDRLERLLAQEGDNYLINYEEPESISVYGEGQVHDADVTATLPSKFSLRDKLPTLRDQGSYGSCWSHAMMAAAEAEAIGKFGAGKNVNYSEKAMCYYANNTVKDPLGNYSSKDKNYRVDKLWTQGNNTEYTSKIMASWVGPIDESLAPYTSMPTFELDDDGEIAKITEKQKLDTSLARDKDEYHLQNYYYINTDDIELAKSYIYQKKALTASFCATGAGYNSTYNTYYAPYNHDYSNHAISIVGWDDTIPKEHFKSNDAYGSPKRDGAWLIRNTWADASKPEEVDSLWGYFWMSYDDPSLGEVLAYDFESADNYDNNYQYDMSAASSEWKSTSELKASNIFTVKASKNGELLEAVGFMTCQANVDYTIYIYLDPEAGKPESGKLISAATVSGRAKVEGYRTVKLSSPVELAYGDRYSIVVKLKKKGSKLSYPVETNWMIDYPDYWYATEVGIDKGQSYVYSSTKGWIDVFNLNTKGTFGNCRIKGYTNNSTKKITHKYTVKYVLDGGKNNSKNVTKYSPVHSDITLKNPSKAGYTFKGWYLDKKFTQPIKTIKSSVRKDLTIYAKWAGNKYTITYKLNGGTNAKGNPTSYKTSNKDVVLKNPTRTGYGFKGWYTDPGCQTKALSKIKAGTHKNLTLYASWTPITYFVNYDPNGGVGYMGFDQVKYDQNYIIRDNHFSRNGYTFVGWAITKDMANAGIVRYQNGDRFSRATSQAGKKVSLYAVWKKN